MSLQREEEEEEDGFEKRFCSPKRKENKTPAVFRGDRSSFGNDFPPWRHGAQQHFTFIASYGSKENKKLVTVSGGYPFQVLELFLFFSG
jgi:hypothetical protein